MTGWIFAAYVAGQVCCVFYIWLRKRRKSKFPMYKCPRCGSLATPPDIWRPEKASLLLDPKGPVVLKLGLAVEDLDHLHKGYPLCYMPPSPEAGLPVKITIVKDNGRKVVLDDHWDEYTYRIPPDQLSQLITEEHTSLSCDEIPGHPRTVIRLIDLYDWDDWVDIDGK